MMYAGIRIFEDPNCFKHVRVRVYPKRKAKSDSHWRRMDKKWAKRYGHKQEPMMYVMPHGIVTHPILLSRIRQEFAAR